MKTEDQVQTFPKTVAELSAPPFRFYILDLKEKQSIAVEIESEFGYKGVSFTEDKEGWNLSPFYIAKGFISGDELRYDFTAEYDKAIQHAKLQ